MALKLCCTNTQSDFCQIQIIQLFLPGHGEAERMGANGSYEVFVGREVTPVKSRVRGGRTLSSVLRGQLHSRAGEVKSHSAVWQQWQGEILVIRVRGRTSV
jgi:hypothetical protein